MVNQYPGLARGPIDHKASSIINAISNGIIDMGSAVSLVITTDPKELLPRVEETAVQGNDLLYGIAVGGDVDGIYGDGSPSTDDSTRAANKAGQGVVVLTQGRCPARIIVSSGVQVTIGMLLANSGDLGGLLTDAPASGKHLAMALQDGSTGNLSTDIIAVDVQREFSV